MTATNAGMILGTAAYMSPEQAKGKTVDRRADIFAFGCVLYEMLTGRAAFDGEDIPEILSRILQREPDWALLPANVSPRIRELLRLCLQKDVKKRRSDAADVRIDIEQALAEPATTMPAVTPTRSTSLAWVVAAAALLVVILAVAGAVVSAVFLSPPPRNETPLWFSVIPPEGNFSSVPAGAISPDGGSIAFNAVNASGANTLWVRSFDSSDSRELPGTTGGLGTPPFWAPDGRSIGFFADGKLQRVSIDGGTPQVLALAPNPRGASWGLDGTIIFAPAVGGGLFKISALGGTATPLKVPDPAKQESYFEYPYFLPDGKHFLYWSVNRDPRHEGTLCRFARFSGHKTDCGYLFKSGIRGRLSAIRQGRGSFCAAFRLKRPGSDRAGE